MQVRGGWTDSLAAFSPSSAGSACVHSHARCLAYTQKVSGHLQPAHFASPCHILVILTVFQIFTLFFMVPFGVRYREVWASLVAQLVKNLPAMQETWVGMPALTPKTPQGECPPGTELAEGQGREAPRRLWRERRRIPSERSIKVGKPITYTVPWAAQEGSRGWGRAHEQEL